MLYFEKLFNQKIQSNGNPVNGKYYMEALKICHLHGEFQESYLTLWGFAFFWVRNIGLESGASSPHSILGACDHEISGGDYQIILMKGHCVPRLPK